MQNGKGNGEGESDGRPLNPKGVRNDAALVDAFGGIARYARREGRCKKPAAEGARYRGPKAKAKVANCARGKAEQLAKIEARAAAAAEVSIAANSPKFEPEMPTPPRVGL